MTTVAMIISAPLVDLETNLCVTRMMYAVNHVDLSEIMQRARVAH